MRERLRKSLPLFGALVLALLPLRAFLGSGVPVGRDLLFYFFPLKAHLVEAVARGELPWVDRFRWGGSPLLGAPSAAPFDPANVLFLALPLGAAMKAWTLLHLGVALAGFAAFARRLGLSRGPAAVAGLVFALGGTTVSVASFPPTLSALSILPWFAAFVFDLVKTPRIREVAAVAIVAALILLATAPEFVLYATFVAVAVFFAAQGEGSGPREIARPLAALAVGALVAASLAAVAVLPAGATAARSIRSPEGGGSLGKGALKPFAVSRIADLATDGIVADWTIVAWAPGVPDYPYLPSVTPGRVAWVLVLAGLVRKGPGRIAAALLALTGLLLALGDKRRRAKVLEEDARQHGSQVSSAPPLRHDRHHALPVVGLSAPDEQSAAGAHCCPMHRSTTFVTDRPSARRRARGWAPARAHRWPAPGGRTQPGRADTRPESRT